MIVAKLLYFSNHNLKILKKHNDIRMKRFRFEYWWTFLPLLARASIEGNPEKRIVIEDFI